jgi:hypothetical protein
VGQGSRDRDYAVVVEGYTELGCSKWKRGKGFLKPNFELGLIRKEGNLSSDVVYAIISTCPKK